MARTKSKVNIKAFRHGIAILKKYGIIPAKVDARSVKPTRHYLSLVKKSADIIDGHIKPVKLPPYVEKSGAPEMTTSKGRYALMDLRRYIDPIFKVFKSGITVIDKGVNLGQPKNVADVILTNTVDNILNLSKEQINALQNAHKPDKNHSFIFTINNKRTGKSYITKIRFMTLDGLIKDLEKYTKDDRGFEEVTISVRIMGDAQINEWIKTQREETTRNRRARANERRRNKKYGGNRGNI